MGSAAFFVRHGQRGRQGQAHAGERSWTNIEWRCIQERWNPEVVIILGTAACYRRATVGSSHDDVHPDNPTLHTGTVRPHPGFVESLLFISSRNGACAQVFQMLPAFSCISWACIFAGDGAAIFSVGSLGYPSGLLKGEEARKCSDSMGWLFWIFMVHPLLGEEDSALSPRWL